MPIIIDEVVISVEVNKVSAGVGSPSSEPDTQLIIEQCVERVLEKLREREESTP